MSNTLHKLNKSEITVETCILQLVKIALKQKASAIAVRFDYRKRKIQVVDNSCGYTKNELASIFSESDNSIENQDIFSKIRCASYAVIVTSKHERCSQTYVKVANKRKHKLIQGYDRPSKGTTVSVYNYNSSSWNEGNKNHSISYVLAVLAFVELKVSFSLRNDNEDKVIFSVGKSHSPWAVFKQVKANQKSKEVIPSVSQIIMKDSKVDNVTEKYETSNEVASPNLPIESLPKLSCAQNDSIFNSNVCSPLSVWSDWSYKPKQLVKCQNVNADSHIFFSSTEQIDISNDICINLSQLSVWSDWSYEPEKSNFNPNRNPQYNFPPISDNAANVRLCNVRPKLTECRISSNTINSLQVIKQVNAEFIAAVANESGKRLIILIDQHAIHERIRYEWLIETYREKGRNSYISEKLHEDLLITDFDRHLLRLIGLYKGVAVRVGIHVKAIVGMSACLVDAVPRCFLKRKRIHNDEENMYKLKKNVKQLLLEVARGLSHNVLPPILPIAINNVIASEACHGAIKFGDPLTVKECTLLVLALQDTKAPTRCAHGRPSIIPLLDLKDVEKQNILKNKKLNFDSLKR